MNPAYRPMLATLALLGYEAEAIPLVLEDPRFIVERFVDTGGNLPRRNERMKRA